MGVIWMVFVIPSACRYARLTVIQLIQLTHSYASDIMCIIQLSYMTAIYVCYMSTKYAAILLSRWYRVHAPQLHVHLT